MSPLAPFADDLERARAARNGAAPGGAEPRLVTLDEFADRDEPGATALVGADQESALIPAGGDVMIYGDGGAGKTTLAVDLACHLAAGDTWLGIPVARPVRVLVIENEGPRPHFRAKLHRKRDHWQGSPLGDRIRVVEEPWGKLTLADDAGRELLAAWIREHELDVVVLGPVTRLGMNEAGTLQEVRDFALLLSDVRGRARRPVTFVLIHHENKSGKVSGAWEGAGDTLLHVQGQGHGRTRVYVQKARWSTAHHATTVQLDWTEGEGFEVADAPADRDDNAIADEILEAAHANGGASWRTVEKTVPGKNDRLRAIRDRLLEGGRLIDAGGRSGMRLWHADDPARPTPQEPLCPDGGTPGAHPHSTPGSQPSDDHCAPVPPPYRGTGHRGAGSSPASEDEKATGEDALP